MKFVISSLTLSTRLQVLGRVIQSKNTLPILSCFLFEVQDGELTITASDNETTLRTRLALSECDGNIRVAINAKTIQDAMREIPEQPLAFYVNEETLEITAIYQNGKYNFMGQNATEYPMPKSPAENGSKIMIDSNLLLSGLSRALFAAADDPLRPIMNGVFFDIDANGLTVVASDGHKLAMTKNKAISAAVTGTFNLPKKPSLLLKNLLPKEDGDTVIEWNASGANITTENYVMMCRLIEGRYPNYRAVIPTENNNNVTVNRAALVGALRRVLIISNAGSALIKLRVEQSRMVISSQDIDFSMSAEESLLCDYSGTPIRIGFKGTFLMELLNNMESEEIIIKLADQSRAGVIVPATNNENEEVLMLLMPMMLPE